MREKKQEVTESLIAAAAVKETHVDGGSSANLNTIRWYFHMKDALYIFIFIIIIKKSVPLL